MMQYSVDHHYDSDLPVVVTENFEDEALARLTYEHFKAVANHHHHKYHITSTVILTGPGLTPEIYLSEGEEKSANSR